MGSEIDCFNLGSSSEGEWFPYQASEVQADGTPRFLDPDPGVGRVCVRSADSEFLEEVYKQTRKKVKGHVFNPKSRKMEYEEHFEQTPEQEKLERELIWDHTIVDWDDKPPFLNRMDKTPIARTVGNKLALMNIPAFARFASSCLERMGTNENERREEETKNS